MNTKNSVLCYKKTNENVKIQSEQILKTWFPSHKLQIMQNNVFYNFQTVFLQNIFLNLNEPEMLYYFDINLTDESKLEHFLTIDEFCSFIKNKIYNIVIFNNNLTIGINKANDPEKFEKFYNEEKFINNFKQRFYKQDMLFKLIYY